MGKIKFILDKLLKKSSLLVESPRCLNLHPSIINLEEMPLIEVDVLLKDNEDIINRILSHSDATDDIKDKLYMAQIRELAYQINSLPYNDVGMYFGGLFKLSLFISHKAQIMDGALSIACSNIPSDQLRRRKPIMRYAIWLTALVYLLERTISNIEVHSCKESDHDRWLSFSQPLYTWCKNKDIDSFRVNFEYGEKNDININLRIINVMSFFNSDTIKYLCIGGTDYYALDIILDAIMGVDNNMCKIVKKAAQNTLDKEWDMQLKKQRMNELGSDSI